MKKSYLSRQLIAVIVIATVLAVAIPVYFFVLKPLFNRSAPQEEPTVYEPLIEGESRSGQMIYICEINESDDQEYDIHSEENGDWGFYLKDGNIAIKNHESISYNYTLLNVRMAMRHLSGSHVSPTSDELKALRKAKADAMSAEELEKLGGENMITLTADDLKGVKVDLAEYGLDDLAHADYYTATDKDGVTHKIYLGDFTPDGGSRYVMYEGRNVVYRLNSTMSGLVSSTKYSIMAPIVMEVGAGAATGDYIPDRMLIYREGTLFLNIQLLSSEQALAAGRYTKSVIVRRVFDEEGNPVLDEKGEEIVNLYDTSSNYSMMLYQTFTQQVDGLEVVYAAPSEFKTIEGVTGYMHSEIPEEVFASFDINLDTPYRLLYYVKENEALECLLTFSRPQSDERGTFYYVYNSGRGVISKIYQSSISFVDESYEFYLGEFIAMVPVDNLVSITIDSSSLPSVFLENGVEAMTETFTPIFKMNSTGTDKVLDPLGKVQIIDVLLGNGKSAPACPDGSNVDNFRMFSYHFQKIRLYPNIEEYLDRIGDVDMEHPDMTIRYTIFGKDDLTCEINYYCFDKAGIWAFYTVNGDGRYLVRTADMQNVLIGAKAVRDGLSVKDLLGEAGD